MLARDRHHHYFIVIIFPLLRPVLLSVGGASAGNESGIIVARETALTLIHTADLQSSVYGRCD